MTPTLWRVLPYALLAVCLTLYTCEVRESGRKDEELRQLAEAHRIAAVVSDSATRKAASAAQEAETARKAAEVQVGRSEAIRKATEASNAQAGNARQAVESALGDSALRLDSLRQYAARLVVATRVDSAAAALRFAQDSTTIVTLQISLRADSSAIAKGIAAQNALIARAVAAENQVSVLNRQRGSTVWRWVQVGGAFVAGYELAKR